MHLIIGATAKEKLIQQPQLRDSVAAHPIAARDSSSITSLFSAVWLTDLLLSPRMNMPCLLPDKAPFLLVLSVFSGR
jgi:hypothetical protein